jgi:hypothetical protein
VNQNDDCIVIISSIITVVNTVLVYREEKIGKGVLNAKFEGETLEL